MKQIVLLSCTKAKKDYSCKASEMYSASANFRKAYQYAQTFADEIYILSAKYGLLTTEDVIEPYNFTLNGQSSEFRRSWTKAVLNKLCEVANISGDHFTLLTGKNYYEFLLDGISNHAIPLKGKSQGQWIPTLNNLLTSNNEITVNDLYSLFDKLPTYAIEELRSIPFSNGIYILYDKDEQFGPYDRIVRVGTHTSDDNLKPRLKNHFESKNQRGSIFRKNIGRAMLHKENHEYLERWNNEKDLHLIDKPFERKIEEQVTDYMNEHIYIKCFRVDDKQTRLRLEGAIIRIISESNNQCSENWLGCNSPKQEINQSGLWCVRGLEDAPLTKSEYMILSEAVKNDKTVIVAHKDPTQKPLKTVKKSEVSASKIGIKEVVAYLEGILEKLSNSNEPYIDIVAGEVAKALCVERITPTICDAMYKLMKEHDTVMYAPPKERGTRVKIRYFNRRSL